MTDSSQKKPEKTKQEVLPNKPFISENQIGSMSILGLGEGTEEGTETFGKAIIGAAAGVPAFINGIADTGKGIYDYVQGNPYTETSVIDISSLDEKFGGDLAYELPKVFVQFLLPFGVISKGSKAIGLTNTLVKSKKAKLAFDAIKTPVQAGLAETLSFRPTEANFYNLFDPLVDKFPSLSNPIYEYLRAPVGSENINFAGSKISQFLAGVLNPIDIALTGREISKGVKGLKKSEQIINNVKSQLDAVKSDKTLNDKIINELGKRDGFELQKKLPGNADDVDVTKLKKVETKFKVSKPKNSSLNIPDTRGQGKFYHGTAQEIALEEGGEAASSQNIYGNGFYTTEDLITASKYQKKGKKQFLKPEIPIAKGVKRIGDLPFGIQSDLAKLDITDAELNQLVRPGIEVPSSDRLRDLARQARQFPIDNKFSGGSRTNVDAFNKIADRLDELADNPPKTPDFRPVTYEIAEKQPVNFYDLDQPVDAELKTFVNNFDDSPFENIVSESINDLGDNYTLAQLFDEIRDYANGRGVSSNTVIDEIFGNFQDYFKGKGFGGFTHQGGKKAGKGKRLHQVRIYFDPANQIDINKVNFDQFSTASTTKKTKKQNQVGGDPSITPTQINPEQVATTQNNAEVVFARARALKEEGAFSGVKSQQDTIDGGIKLLADTPKLKEYAKAYAAMYDKVPTDELNYALAEKITFTTQEMAEANQKLINSIQVVKDPNVIEQDINTLLDVFDDLDEWLRLGIPIRSEPARALASMQIPTTGLSPEELAKMSPAERFRMGRLNQTEITFSSADDLQLRGEELRQKLITSFEEAKSTGDFTKLNKLTNTIKRTEGKVEKLEKLYKTGLIHRILDKADPATRIFNEIRINAMLSAPTTQEINLVSGVAETLQSAFELGLGATNKTERDAAMQYIIGLTSDFNFSAKAWKQSWNLEDNFVNPGSIKTDYADRFAVSMAGDSLTSKWVNRLGKYVVRVPSRLMTANDALIQSRNIIGSAHYEAYMEGVKKGKKGKDLNDFIRDNVNKVIDTFSTGSAKNLTRTQGRILKRAKQFGRRSTYTEDIRTDGFLIGKTAKALNQFANQVPMARTFMSFVRTPNNILKRQLRRTPLLNNLMGEVANDLNSLDPIVRQQARGQLRFSKGAGLIFLGLAFNKLNEDADIHLTGSGPNLFQPEGRIEFKKKWDNDWRPYSIGYAKKDENGDYVIGEDGKKVFEYYSYQRFDPLSGWIGLMTDFTRISGYLTQGETDEFITKYLYAFSRNIFDRSYLSDLRDFAIFSSDPSRGRSFFGDILVSGAVPNIVAQANRLPGDILDMMGIPKEETEIFDIRRDTKVRAGDELFGMKAADNQLLKELREMLNKLSERAPGFSMNLPPSRQHITDDFKTFPEKVGPDLISWMTKTETKNHKILTVLGDLGKTLPEPSDVILGSLDKSTIAPIPLNTTQYQEVQKIINNEKFIGGLTLKQALNKYMETDHFKKNYELVKRIGRKDSDIAISRIMSGIPGAEGILGLGLRGINNLYIERGQDLWIKQQGTDFRNKQVELLKEKNDNYRKEYDKTVQESDLTF